MTCPTTAQLDLVFGPDSKGSTAEARAGSSVRQFVRSQSQVAVLTSRAKGLPITAADAFRLVGFEGLMAVVETGAAVINASLNEPSQTIRTQRSELNVSIDDVAKATGLSTAEVEKSEERGSILPIRKLLRLSQALALDDETLSAIPHAGRDGDLAYRLRTMQSGPTVKLSASLVLKLSEAAWIISKQHKLTAMLDEGRVPPAFPASGDYARPAWKRGWELAERTRALLGEDPVAPIPSIRALIDRINIPLIQAELGYTFAGATVQNGADRGIVVNIQGDNSNVWVRRATLCHELGHLFWDPADQLQRLHVDSYQDIRTIGETGIEARANAFAIAFIAPPAAVREIVKLDISVEEQVGRLMQQFGLAGSAARYHLSNVAREWGIHIDTTHVRSERLPQPDDDWYVREDWTVDFFPIQDVPTNRKGRFAGLVAAAAKRGNISMDYAAVCLGVTLEQMKTKLDAVLSISAPDFA